MWIYIAVIAVIIYVIYKERQALGCPNIPNGADCDNANGKAVRGSDVNNRMGTSEILNKVEFASRYEDRWVKWRIFFMISVAIAVIFPYISTGTLVTEHNLIVCIVVVVSVLLSVSNFYKFHLTDIVANNISSAVNILRSRT